MDKHWSYTSQPQLQSLRTIIPDSVKSALTVQQFALWFFYHHNASDWFSAHQVSGPQLGGSTIVLPTDLGGCSATKHTGRQRGLHFPFNILHGTWSVTLYLLKWLKATEEPATNNDQESHKASRGFLSRLWNRFERTMGNKNKIADWLSLQSSWFPLIVPFGSQTIWDNQIRSFRGAC